MREPTAVTAQGRLLVLGLLVVLTPSGALAHHPGASGSVLGHRVGRTLGRMAVSAQSTLSQGVQYQQLPDAKPSYETPLGGKGDDVVSIELGGTLALADRVEMVIFLPLVSRRPDVERTDVRGGTGIGDILLGARMFPWVSSRRDASFAVGATLSFPSGGVRFTETDSPDGLAGEGVSGTTGSTEAWTPRMKPAHTLGPDQTVEDIEAGVQPIGSGLFVPRVHASYLHIWHHLTLEAEVGVSWSFREDANVLLNYSATVGWSPDWPCGIFARGEARTFLRAKDSGLASYQSEAREPGDTSVVISPGIWGAPSRFWSLALSPHLPVTRTRDYEWGFTGSMAWVID